MSGEKPNLTGVWHSCFHLGEGLTSEHDIKLDQRVLIVSGMSGEGQIDAWLRLDLWLREAAGPGIDRGKYVLDSFWREKTLPDGEYEGRTLFGVGQLVMKSEGLWSGQWLGFNRPVDDVNNGQWTLERHTDRN